MPNADVYIVSNASTKWKIEIAQTWLENSTTSVYCSAFKAESEEVRMKMKMEEKFEFSWNFVSLSRETGRFVGKKNCTKIRLFEHNGCSQIVNHNEKQKNSTSFLLSKIRYSKLSCIWWANKYRK